MTTATQADETFEVLSVENDRGRIIAICETEWEAQAVRRGYALPTRVRRHKVPISGGELVDLPPAEPDPPIEHGPEDLEWQIADWLLTEHRNDVCAILDLHGHDTEGFADHLFDFLGDVIDGLPGDHWRMFVSARMDGGFCGGTVAEIVRDRLIGGLQLATA